MVDEVDPRAPRFGQAVTATLALCSVALGEPGIVYLLTVLLVVPVVSRWRVDPYGFAWKRGIRQVVGPPGDVESAIPHRFARLVGATFTTVGSGFLVAALVTDIGALAFAGYALVAAVGGLAALSATTGLCVGCRLYRQVALFRDLGVLVSPPRPDTDT